MTYEEAYEARPKPLNMSIPLEGMYLYFFEAGEKFGKEQTIAQVVEVCEQQHIDNRCIHAATHNQAVNNIIDAVRGME